VVDDFVVVESNAELLYTRAKVVFTIAPVTYVYVALTHAL
jgi:hypothetical protein